MNDKPYSCRGGAWYFPLDWLDWCSSRHRYFYWRDNIAHNCIGFSRESAGFRIVKKREK